jgi:hypothetical protein
MASYLDEFLNKPRNPTNVDIFSGLYDPEQIANLENQYGNQYGIQNSSSGPLSDARHMAAMNNLSNSLSPMNNGIGNFIGDTGAFLAGAINEIPALGRGFNKQNLGEIVEDIKANYAGSFGTPNSTTAEDIYSQVFSGAVPQRVASSNNQAYGAAQASDLPGIPSNSLERDFPGMSTGDIIDSMNNRAFIGRQITPMAKPNVVDPNRIPGRIQEAVEPQQYRIRDQLDRDFLQGGILKDARKSLGETFGPIGNKIGSGLGSLKDFAIDKGTQGFNLGKMALSGIGNAIMPGLGFVLSNLKGEPLFRETLANSRKANPLGTRGVGPNGVQLDGVSDFGGFTTDDLGRITNNGLNYNTPEGIMSGYNAGFDLASAALGRIGKIQDGLALGKFKNVNKANQKINNLKTAAVASAQAKRQAYQDEIDRARDSAAREKARARSITDGYGGGNDNNRPSTGPTSVGANMGVGGGHAADYGFLKDGGSVGLASMFTRRR